MAVRFRLTSSDSGDSTGLLDPPTKQGIALGDFHQLELCVTSRDTTAGLLTLTRLLGPSGTLLALHVVSYSWGS